MAQTIGTGDVNTIITRHGRSATLRRATRTLDPEGKVTAYSNSDTTVTFVLQDLSRREDEEIAAGHMPKSERKAFVKASVDLAVNDILIISAGTEEYEVVGMKKFEDAASGVYQIAYLRRSA
jgi:hypothetical protein